VQKWFNKANGCGLLMAIVGREVWDTHPTRTIDGSAGIMGVSGGFLRNFGALGAGCL
jgi:hypothetical protein